MAVAIGEIYQLTIVGVAAGQAIETVLHFRARTLTPTPTALRASAEAYLALQAQLQDEFCVYDHLVMKQMTPVPFDEDIWASTATPHGLYAGALGNNTIAFVFTKRTGVSGKTHRGRLYVGGLAGSAIDGQRVAPAEFAAGGTFATAVINQFGDAAGTDATLAIGVYSRVIGGSTPFTLAGWQPLTRLDPQPILGNQRRRRVGVGI